MTNDQGPPIFGFSQFVHCVSIDFHLVPTVLAFGGSRFNNSRSSTGSPLAAVG
jgi:hypothetical protein